MTISLERKTKETNVFVAIDHPGEGHCIRIEKCGFLTHMIELLCHNAQLGIEIVAEGDTHVDAHHLTEDIGIVLGQAICELARQTPRERYGWCLLPMDGSLAQVALDFSGRGALHWKGAFSTPTCGGYDMELVEEFFRALARSGHITLHIALLAADNSHHAAEAVFKGFGRALKAALVPAAENQNPSSKGVWL